MATDDGISSRLDELTATLSDLSDVLDQAPDTESLLIAVCAEAVRIIPGADMASITTITSGGGFTTPASTDPRATRLDQAQYAAGEGPCLQAARSGAIVLATVTELDGRWPEFVHAAGELGVGSFLAAPLRVGDGLGGALNLFGFGTHGYQEFDTAALRLYTLGVESALRTLLRYRQASRLVDNLTTAMRTRAVIEQAKGMLMAIHHIDEKKAMQRLVTESQHTNTKLRDIATRFVDRILGTPRTPAP